MKPAFSAVELLLVAGIASILVAIAVPGYMEAKARAETTDVRAMQRQVGNAILQYKIDCNQFPEPCIFGSPNTLHRLVQKDFMSVEPSDRFKDNNLKGLGGYYSDPYLWYGWLTPDREEYKPTLTQINDAISSSSGNSLGILPEKRYWFLKSIGPDQTDWHDEGGERNSKKSNILGMVQYDATNGVFSLGEIIDVGNLKY